MSNNVGSTKDLSASRTEALHGLLSSLGRANDITSSDTPLIEEQLHRLTEKINEILGDANDHGSTLGDQSSQGHVPRKCNLLDTNPQTQILNENGLPIVDISEQVDEDFQSRAPSTLVPESDLIPLLLLPPDERERRRRERDRILDLLEEEERLQQLQEKQVAEEEQKEAIKKRKESAKAELDQLKAASVLQKKMGRALVRHTERTEEDRREEDARPKPLTRASTAKKSVSFADAPALKTGEGDHQALAHPPDWGDVTPGRLRAQSRIPLVSTTEVEKYPMKMHVVERRPTATPVSLIPRVADSDDESTSSIGQVPLCSENDSSDDKDRSSSSSDDHLSDDESLEEGFDYDVAQHHREIALEYHKKRLAIGAGTAFATDALDDPGQYETPNTLLPLSRFRADRMTTAYDMSRSPASTSIEQAVIPASRQKPLRNSVRLGRIENNQLVGGVSGESGSEDETVREVIQLLKTGRIQNAGPDVEPSTSTSPRESSVEPPSVLPNIVGRRPSRFKVACGGETAEPTLHDDNSRDNPYLQPTISNVVERKAPTSYAKQRFPVNKPPPRSPATTSAPTIIDSPSFPMMATGIASSLECLLSTKSSGNQCGMI